MSEDPTGSALGGATGGGGAGGSSSAGATAGAGVLATPSPNGGATPLRAMTRGLLLAHDHETPSTGGEIDYLRTAWGTDHLLPGADAHPEYATDLGLAAVQAQLEAVYTETEADARFEQLTRKGAADGYAPLDAGGLVPTLHLPPLAVTDTFVAASEAAMLALAAQVGDICIRTDLGETYILATAPATVLANWLEMAAAGQVVSVNGETGVVSLSAADVGASAADHTHPSEQSEQWRFQDNPTMADPGDGYLRSDTGVLATATMLAISRTTQDGYDIPPTGFGVAGGDTVYVQDRDDNSKWVRYTADEPLARFATYATGAVTVTDSAGTIAHGQIVQVTFSLAGGGGGGGTDYLTEAEADGLYLPLAHAGLPDVHHAQGHNHTAADGAGVLTNDEHDGYSQYVNLGADPSTPAANRIRLYSKDNGSGVSTLYYLSESGTVYEMPTLVTGGNGSGAPSNASYVTLASESKLSGEAVLGTAVIMSGVVGSRPAFGTAGRLYLGTDTDLVYRDTGSAWETFATRAAGGGSYLPLTGGTLTGAVVLQGASGTTNVLQAKLSTDTQPRFRFDANGLLEWGAGGAAAPTVSLYRTSGSDLETSRPFYASSLNATGNVSAGSVSGHFRLASGTIATAGALRSINGTNGFVAWRNAGNTANLTLGMNSSDHLDLTVAAGAVTTTVGAAGGASALPATPTGYLTVTINGTARKIGFYAV